MSTTEFIEISYNSALYKKIVKFREEVLRIPLGLKFTDKDLETDKHEMIFALVIDKIPIGCLQARKLDSQTAKLRQMAVHPDYQGLGLGKLLLSQAEKILRKKNIQYVELNARKTALKFYQKSGFKVCSSEFIEVGIPHIKMTKIIGT